MEKKEKLIIYPLTILLFLIIDGIWIKLFMKSLYLENLAPILLREGTDIKVRMFPAFLSYVCIYGLYVITVLKNAHNQKAVTFFLNSFICGVLVYGTYDFTCLALFKNFNYKIALIDTIWGGILYTFVSVFVFFVLQKQKKRT